MLPTREQFDRLATMDTAWVVSGNFAPILVVSLAWLFTGAVRVAFLPAPTLEYSPDLKAWWPL